MQVILIFFLSNGISACYWCYVKLKIVVIIRSTIWKKGVQKFKWNVFSNEIIDLGVLFRVNVDFGCVVNTFRRVKVFSSINSNKKIFTLRSAEATQPLN